MNKPLQKQCIVLVVTISLTLIGNAFPRDIQSNVVWAVNGVAIALYLMMGKWTLLSTFFGVLIGHLLNHMIWAGSLSLPIFFMHVNSAMAVVVATGIAGTLMKGLLPITMDIKKLAQFIGIATMVAALAATIGNSGVHLASEATFSFKAWRFWFLGDMFGILIFTPAVVMAFTHHAPPKRNVIVREAMIYGLTFMISFGLFSQMVPFLDFFAHKFLFFPLVIVAAYKLPYRSLPIGLTLFLLALAIVGLPLETFDLYFYLFDINGFLLFVVIIFMVFKYVFSVLENRQRELLNTESRTKNLVHAMDMLFDISSDSFILRDDSDAVAKKIFHMIYDMVEEFDYGACMRITSDNVIFIDTIGHNKDHLNSIGFEASNFVQGLDAPKHITDARAWLRENGHNVDDFFTHVKPYKESVLFTIEIDPHTHLEFSYDIAKEASNHVTPETLDFLTRIQQLLNGFFENQRLLEQSGAEKQQMVRALLEIIGLFDASTHQHSEDVARLARDIGEALHLDPVTINELYWAGIVHDIGKIGVPRHIVNKPSRLTLKEYEIMQRHPALGHELLKPSENLRTIAHMVFDHHQRYDGLGYPEGLKGDEIPFTHYILIISEVIASMARAQNYSPKQSITTIKHELTREADKAFPSSLASSVVEMIDNGLIDHFYT